ncbi:MULTISPECIES: AMP-binding protein [unclassified Streptomyces]|uniref:AMP-binding protein n=1 Tax=unclassified Streptomyces TaxID=2593676 RepID=UPI0033BE3E87
MSREHWLLSRLDSWEGDDALAHRYAADGEFVELSRAALLAAVRDHAEGLVRRAVRPGDRVAVVAARPQPFVAAFLGAMWAGAIPVPVAPPAWSGEAGWSETVAAALDLVAARILVGPEEVLRLVPGTSVARVGHAELPVTATGTVTAAEFDAARTAYVQFSSGSTGRPRAVGATCGALLANSVGIMRDALGARAERDHGVSWLPLHHDMGLVGFVLAPMAVGVSVTLMTPIAFLRDPQAWMGTMARVGGTITAAPNFAYALAARRSSPQRVAGLNLTRARVLLCGGEPINRRALESFTRLHSIAGLDATAVRPCYGMAEHTLALTVAPAGVRSDRVDSEDLHVRQRARPAGAGKAALDVVSCGHPLPGHSVRIADGTGRPLDERQVGEIWARGPSVAGGYIGDEDASVQVFRTDGWLRTGDRGYLTREGGLHVVGRCKDVLIVNGRNIDPQRVEWLAETVEGVRPNGAVAFTRPGSDTEEVVVVIECLPGSDATVADMVRQVVAEQLSVQVADVVLGRPGCVERTTSGKPRRYRMRAAYLTHRAEATNG